MDALLGVAVEEDLRLAVAEEDDLVVGLALRLREGPAVDAREVRGEVPRRHRQPLPRHDEDEQAVLRQVARAVREEGVLDALLLTRVPVVRRVQVEEPEGAVGDRGGEEVGPEHAVEAVLRLLRALGVKLHAERFDGSGVWLSQALGQPGEGVTLTAAGVEDPEDLVAAGVAGGWLDELRDQVGDAGRCRVEPALCLRCQSHEVSPFR